MFTCILRCYVDFMVLVSKFSTNFSEGIDSVDLRVDFGGQVHGGKECPFNSVV